MIDQEQHGAPASLDEVARLFLRHRDFACPGCGYNRRDGTTAACPECDLPLTFDASEAARPLRTSMLWMLVALFLVSLVDAVFDVALTTVSGWAPLGAWDVARHAYHLGGGLLVCVSGAWCYVALRRHEPRPRSVSFWFRLTALLVVAKTLLGLAINFWWLGFL